MRLNKKLSKLIARERVCRVATAGADGKPHVVPVCHVMNGGKIYFGSDKNARKVANLRENPRISLTIDLYSEDWSQLRGVMIMGTVNLIERGPRFNAGARPALRKVPAVSRGSGARCLRLRDCGGHADERFLLGIEIKDEC